MEDDDQKVLDLVKELVHRLLYNSPHSIPSSSSSSNPGSSVTPQQFQQSLRYALRILSSRLNPSIAPDDAAMAESIKRHLATQGKSSEALTFTDLYSKFSMKTGPGSVKNKWAVLYLLKTISEDQRGQKSQPISRVSNGFLDPALAGGLPALFGNESSDRFAVGNDLYKGLSSLDNNFSDTDADVSNNYSNALGGFSDNLKKLRGLSNIGKVEKKWGDCGLNEGLEKLRVAGDSSRILRSKENVGKGWSGGVLMVSKDPENIREMAYREFAVLLKEENEVTEEALVRDVLYACQGIDGKYVKFDEKADGYVLPELVKVSRATRVTVKKLCELGWLFRKVKGYITESIDRFPAEDVGTVGQAFCAALQDELSEYYRLLAVLEAQAMNPIPLVSENASSGN